MSMKKTLEIDYDIIYNMNDQQLEIVIECIYYWAKIYMKRIAEILIIYREQPILEIMKKHRGICNPSNIERTDEEVERLAECLEHNKKVLQEIAEVLGIDSNVSVDPTVCIEEAIEWTSEKR